MGIPSKFSEQFRFHQCNKLSINQTARPTQGKADLWFLPIALESSAVLQDLRLCISEHGHRIQLTNSKLYLVETDRDTKFSVLISMKQ